MSGSDWWAPGYVAPVVPKQKPHETVWSVRKTDGHTITCEFVSHGESYGWELVMLRDEEWFFSHRCVTRAAVEVEAAELKAKYPREGSVLIG